MAMGYIVPFLFFFVLFSNKTYGQGNDDYEEVLVTLNVQRLGSIEIPAIIHKQESFLAITDLFDFLKIKNNPSPDLDTVSGFFIIPRARFLIDNAGKKITFQNKVYDLKPSDLIRTETGLYLKSSYFAQVFALQCSFDFRSLSITLTTTVELPTIREMRIEQIRKNVSKLRGERKADTIINRSYPFFNIGMADWSVMTMQQTNTKSDTRVNLALGGTIAGGEATVSLNYNNLQPISPRQQYYNWRYVNNHLSAVKQVTAGKINSQAVSSLFAPVVGVQVTNTPTTYRKSFGTYQLSDKTEPGWIVELYVNNVLVNYVKADASGFFTFEIPLVYGNSNIRLHFYGPWGEERTKEQKLSIPFNFLPKGELEYTFSAGIVEDVRNSRFSRLNFNYGMGQRITIGAGIEYLSSLLVDNKMPFVNASMRLGPRMLLSGEHINKVRSKGVFSYRFPSNAQLEVNYIKYENGQKAIRHNFLEERKAVLSFPFRSGKLTSFSRLTFNQILIPKYKLTTAEFLFSSFIGGVSSNLTTYAILFDRAPTSLYSNLSMTFRLPGKFRLTPQIQYEYTDKKISLLKGEVEKNIFRNGFLNAFYENNIRSNVKSIGLGFRFDMSFAQLFFSGRQSNREYTTIQTARGSMMYDGKTDYISADNRQQVGRGVIVVLPFLDINCNGRRDAGEPKAFGLNLKINGGRMARNDKDTLIRITGLEAYSNCFIELDGNYFENISWQLRNKSMMVTVEPNYTKVIQVPVAVVGQVSGTVQMKGPNGLKGQGRIIVDIFNSRNSKVAQTITEGDGYFSYLGLAPGTYTVKINNAQLLKLNIKASPAVSFKISPNKEGDVVDNVEFVLHPDVTEKQ